jgi:uncharacterized protein YeaC (DUF1315 family)
VRAEVGQHPRGHALAQQQREDRGQTRGQLN